MNRFSFGFSPMTLLSKCYCAQASWLAGLVFRVIESSGHTGVKCHGKGRNKVRRSQGNQGARARVKGGGPSCTARPEGPSECPTSGQVIVRDLSARFLQQNSQGQKNVQVFLEQLCRLLPLL